MRRLPALLCLVLLVRIAPAFAQTEIHRCIGADGHAVFTDQPCAALQATPVTATAPGASTGAAPSATTPPTLCAASRASLRQSVIDAFASRDANRLAGLMLWDGYGRGAAVNDIRALAQTMKQPLLSIDSAEAPAAASSSFSDAAAATPEPAPANDQLLLHLAGNDGSGSPRELRFDLVRQAGCLGLRSAN
jgi:hypothetical protein